MKKFPFEDFTLVMTRNCNLACEYCPLEHFDWSISTEVLDIFFNKISNYNDYKLYITLFWWEPLLNRKWIEYIFKLFERDEKIFSENNIQITLKIVSNWSLLDDKYIELLAKLNSFTFIKLVLNISIDWNKETQLRQRNYKWGHVDYYSKLIENIHKLISSDINIELWMVMSFFNDDIFSDVVFLLKEFKIPLFLMPVDLTLNYIDKDKNIYKNITKYLVNIEKTLKLIELNKLSNFIVNYKNEYRDIKIPPIWPTIDINGDIYTTRDFLFTMDKSIVFDTIWNIKNDNLLEYFDNNIWEIEQETLKLYYWRTLTINKKIWDYFTKLVYKK